MKKPNQTHKFGRLCLHICHIWDNGLMEGDSAVTLTASNVHELNWLCKCRSGFIITSFWADTWAIVHGGKSDPRSATHMAICSLTRALKDTFNFHSDIVWFVCVGVCVCWEVAMPSYPHIIFRLLKSWSESHVTAENGKVSPGKKQAKLWWNDFLMERLAVLKSNKTKTRRKTNA